LQGFLSKRMKGFEPSTSPWQGDALAS